MARGTDGNGMPETIAETSESDPRQPRRDTPPAETVATESGAAATGGSSGDREASGAVELRRAPRGRYRIRGERARGGLGRVLDAFDTALGRDVVLKELLVNAPEREARFVREVFLTARLEHPGIVPVHDAGRWEDSGEPYYQMKLVDGEPLSRLLAAATTLDARLALMPHALAVVDAVAYAHSQGVIHRDLKPDNIVVGAFGETMVIDWGLAKDVNVDDVDHGRQVADEYSVAVGAELTVGGAVVGTPSYMPPEQARGDVAAETADVYSLGALLYHIVAGEPPYPGSDSGQVIERVRREPPPRLSSRAPQAPPDLCAIIERAMARSPSERYADASELGAELQRFVAGRMVRAYRYRWHERARRWLATHRSAIALIVSAVVAFGAAGAVMLAGEPPDPCPDDPLALAGVWDAEAQASIESSFQRLYGDDASAVSVVSGLDGYARRWRSKRRDSCAATRVRGQQSDAVFEARARCFDRRKRELAGLVSLLATTEDETVLRKADQAVASLTLIDSCSDVDRLMARVPPPDDPADRAVAEAIEADLGRLRGLVSAAKLDEGLSLAVDAAARAQSIVHAPTVAVVELEHGKLLARRGEAKEAEAMFRRALASAARARDDSLLAQVWTELIRTIGYYQRRPEDARALEPYARAAVVRAGSPACAEASLIVALGAVVRRYDEAISSREQALAVLESRGQKDSFCYAQVAVLLGAMLYTQGRYDDAIARYGEALDYWESRPGDPGITTAAVLNNIGLALKRQKKLNEATGYHRRALAIAEANLGPDHLEVGNSLNHIGNVLVANGDLDKADDRYRRALSILERTYGPESTRVASALMNIGVVAQERGELGEAYEAYQRSLELKEKAVGPKDPLVATSLVNLGHVLTAMERYDEAVAALERAVAITEHHKIEPAWLAEAQFALAQALWRVDDRRAAKRRRAMELARDAQRRYEAMGDPAAAELREVKEWLESPR